MPSPRGLTYAQALAVWRHRLDAQRRSNLARLAAVAGASARLRDLGPLPGQAAPDKREAPGRSSPGLLFHVDREAV